MRYENQYSEYIERWKESTGIDPFLEYKIASEERKLEIEEQFFSICRNVGEVPCVKLTNSQNLKSLVSLSNVDVSQVYKNNNGVFEYGFNNSGLTFLSQFFQEFNDVRKGVGRDHPTVREYFNDDYMLRKVIRKMFYYSDSVLSFHGWLRISGAGYCYNFRPAVAMALYRYFGNNDCKVLDSSAGFGSRLLGAYLSGNVVEYLGIDPNTAKSCDRLLNYLNSTFPMNVSCKVLEMGSEDFTPENFPEYQNYFDLYFTSPPYFDTERYSDDETQSYKKFPTYDRWVKGFYQSTINNACSALKNDGIFAINIFEKVPNIKEITKLFLANNGWYVYQEDKYMLRTMPGSNHKFDSNGNPIKRDLSIGLNYEPIWYAKHYTRLLSDGLISQEKAKEFEKRVLL